MIPIATVRDCEVCAGRGVVYATDQRRTEIQTCPRCAGTGALIVKENRS